MKKRTNSPSLRRNLVAKNDTNKGGPHKDKKRASRLVRGSDDWELLKSYGYEDWQIDELFAQEGEADQ